MTGEKLGETQENFDGSKSLLNMTLFLRTTSGWVVSFTGHIHGLAIPSIFGVMLPIHRISVAICSREVVQKSQPCPIHCHTLSFILSWPPPWIICHRSFSPPLKSLALFCVTDVGYIKALLWWITSCRHQLIIQEVDLGTPHSVLWSLHASMASFSLPATGIPQWPSTRRFCVVFDAKSFIHTTWIVLQYLEGHYHYRWFLSHLLTVYIIDW